MQGAGKKKTHTHTHKRVNKGRNDLVSNSILMDILCVEICSFMDLSDEQEDNSSVNQKTN
jgi:hypothetical protein